MVKAIMSETPASLLRRQIKNISLRMQTIVAKTRLFPQRNIAGLNKLKVHFSEIKSESYLCCNVMEQTKSIESEERAANAINALMTELVNIKNEAGELVENEITKTKKFWRF